MSLYFCFFDMVHKHRVENTLSIYTHTHIHAYATVKSLQMCTSECLKYIELFHTVNSMTFSASKEDQKGCNDLLP